MKLFIKNGEWWVRMKTINGNKEISTGLVEGDMNDAIALCNKAGIEQMERDALKTIKAEKFITTARLLGVTGVNAPIRDVVPSWLKNLVARGYSPQTGTHYRSAIREFLRHHGSKKPREITPEDCADFLDDMTGRLAKRVMSLYGLRNLMEYCRNMGYCPGNPAKLVSIKLDTLTHEEKETKPRLPFTDDEVEKLLEFTKEFDPEFYQNRNGPVRCVPRRTDIVYPKQTPFWHVAIALARYTGLRLGDVACLEWASLAKPGYIIVWTRKTDSRVELPISQELQPYLWRILPHENPNHPDAKFCFPLRRCYYRAQMLMDGSDKSPRSVKWWGLSWEFTRICAYLGLPRGKSFHSLRHRYAQALREQGVPIEEVARNLAHTSTKCTLLYTHETPMIAKQTGEA